MSRTRDYRSTSNGSSARDQSGSVEKVIADTEEQSLGKSAAME